MLNMQIHTYIYIYIYIYIHITHMYICIQVCVCIIHIYIYIYTYVYTHIIHINPGMYLVISVHGCNAIKFVQGATNINDTLRGNCVSSCDSDASLDVVSRKQATSLRTSASACKYQHGRRDCATTSPCGVSPSAQAPWQRAAPRPRRRRSGRRPLLASRR